MEEDLSIKSEIIASGSTMKVPEGFSHPFADAKDGTTGSIIISFGNSRMRMRYSPESGEFDLVPKGDGFSLVHDGKTLIEYVEFVQAFCHSPFQANVSIPKYESVDSMMAYLDRIVATGTVEGIPMSCGPDDDIDKVCRYISAIHSKYPDIPIGLSYRVCSKDDLQKLKSAGLTEFKITVGSTNGRIFKMLQPDEDLDSILDCLKDAVIIFGKGKVQTGLFIGVGETDEEVIQCMESVSSIGLLTDIKVKKLSPKVRSEYEAVVGKIEPVSKDRLMLLGMKLKSIEEKHGLSGTTNTLCLSCRCCNIVPFKDF